MTSIRRPWYAALVLAALATGCSTEPEMTGKDGTPNAPTPAETAPAPAPGPVTAPASADAATKGEMKAETAAPEPAKNEPEPKLEGPKDDAAPKGDQAKSAAAAPAVVLTSEEIAEIKKLPADDQILALKQAVCPVGESHLGEMGKPVKVTAEGRTFFLCCDSCMKEVKKDPKAVVAKLPSQ